MTPTSYDPTFNITFVQLVEKYPPLYDHNNQYHGNKHVTEKAWAEIGNETKLSVSQCKEKWRNLRTVFCRSLKRSGPNARRTNRDYYLKDVMKFVLPYIRVKHQQPGETFSDFASENSNDSTATERGELKHCISPVSDREIVQSSDVVECSYGWETKNQRRPSGKPTVTTHPVQSDSRQDEDRVFPEYSVSQSSNAGNPDLDFLKSLLPDMYKMTDYQKRAFKRKTLEVIDSILCDGPPTD